ncbi:MAG: DUF58 domain-containing protein [Thermoleophilia bacterium]|nr:DUF58 domain-containing protein [Thermoleophilia bacterium]
MLTRRGTGLLLLAMATYLGGRLVGTYELFLASFGLVALALLSWIMVLITGARIDISRSLDPETPVAGDGAAMHMRVRNGSLVPSASLQINQDLRDMTGSLAILELSPLGPRADHAAQQPLPPLRRGVFSLPGPTLSVSDPLGLARRRRRAGGELVVTVLPNIARLRSCVFFGDRGLGQSHTTRPSPAHGSLDLRGVRPHQPGEPLSRIDWKSTAKTGSLMLREVEEPTRSDVILLLDGTRAAQVGDASDNTFETAVSAAGSIGDYVLREGFAVTLVRHWGDDDVVSLDAGDRGRNELLKVLAGAKADAPAFLNASLERHRALVAKGRALVVVSPASDPGLLTELVSLREKGLPVYLIHIVAPSFAPGEAPAPTDPDRKRFLLQLLGAGIPSVSLRRGEHIEASLSFPAGDQGRRPASTATLLGA